MRERWLKKVKVTEVVSDPRQHLDTHTSLFLHRPSSEKHHSLLLHRQGPGGGNSEPKVWGTPQKSLPFDASH